MQARVNAAVVLRAAYFMSNWDFALETAKNEGVVQSLFPASFQLPMVAPKDIGELAARLLTEPAGPGRLLHIEGPERYTPSHVAAAFGKALNRPVRVEAIPRPDWKATFESMGFSELAAESYTRMTSVTVDENYEFAGEPERGKISIEQYISELVETKKNM